MSTETPTKPTQRVIRVYEKDNCQQCVAVKRWLTARDIPFTSEDATEESNLRAITALGHQQAPVIIDGDHHFSGFDVNELHALQARWAE